MYDPLELARKTAKMVCQGTARQYYRFRPARFYGGIATADCLGCNLRCAFCWAWGQLHQVQKLGQFYGPAEVAARLTAIARKKGFPQVRISGNEPTLGMPHLLEVFAREYSAAESAAKRRKIKPGAQTYEAIIPGWRREILRLRDELQTALTKGSVSRVQTDTDSSRFPHSCRV